MNIRTLPQTFENLTAPLVVVLVKAESLQPKKGGKKQGVDLAGLNEKLGGDLLRKLAALEFKGKPAESCLINLPSTEPFGALLFYGWDGKQKSNHKKLAVYRKLGSTVLGAAKKLKASKVALLPDDADFTKDNLFSFLEGLLLTAYTFIQYKSKQDPRFELSEINILGGAKIKPEVVEQAKIVTNATIMARDLVNMPARDCTPSYLVTKAREVAKNGKLKITVFEKKDLEKLGANSLLSVASGSDEPPYLIKLVYKPKGKAKKIISIVGKGVTFDTGGYSIKTAGGMETMKCDMSGAAAVIATMQAVALLEPKIEVRGYVPTVENMVNGHATRPGDIVRATNKKTIEILNTDAEGRLILADALCMAESDKCDAIIDLATLTGACVVALGPDYAGLFSTDERLAAALSSAAEESAEPIWRMPLAEEYREAIKSSVADIKNTGGKAGAITAALFLNEFVEKTPWAHLDIAGPAFVDGDKDHIKKGGTGFGVRTLVRYLMGV